MGSVSVSLYIVYRGRTLFYAGDRGRVRFGQILPCAGHFVCGGLKAISGIPLHQHQTPHDAGGESADGRGAVCPRGAGASAAAGCSGDPKHLWYGNGAAQYSPIKDLTEQERDIVFHSPAVKKNIIYQNKTSGAAGTPREIAANPASVTGRFL